MNTNVELSHKLYDLVATSCGLDAGELSPQTRVDDIGLDSLSMTQVLTALEVELGIELSEDELYGLLEARALGDYLHVLANAVGRLRGPHGTN